MNVREVIKDVDIVSELLSYKSALKLSIWSLAENKVWLVASTEYDVQINEYGSALEAVLRLQKMVEECKRTIDKIGGTYKFEKWEKPFYCEDKEFLKKVDGNSKFPCYFKDEKKERVEHGIQFQLELPTEKVEAQGVQ